MIPPAPSNQTSQRPQHTPEETLNPTIPANKKPSENEDSPVASSSSALADGGAEDVSTLADRAAEDAPLLGSAIN